MKKIILLCFIFLFPNLVMAHVDNVNGGFLAGLLHPVLGFDHLLAMVSVGIVSAQMGGASIWQIPATFVFVMLLGGITGIMGIPIPLFSVETGIAASVFLLGIAIASGRKTPYFITILFVGFFAIFHGHAHGIEMPDIAQPFFYILGFILGTAGLHIIGLVISLLAKKNSKSLLFLRHLGSGIAGIGFYYLFIN